MPFIYPKSQEFFEIDPVFVQRERAGRVLLDYFPVVTRNSPNVRWTQEDNYGGLQQFRGMDGEPTHVQRVGMKTYSYEPGVFGEFLQITETELTERAGFAPLATTPVDVSDLVMRNKRQLIGRENDRMEASAAAILTTGTLSLSKPGPNAPVAYTDSYPIQNYTPGTPFATVATATPIAAFQSVQQLQLGLSVDFGSDAVALSNQKTANYILNNQNANDFGGRRTQFGATINSLGALNDFWKAQNLPSLRTYDAGYYPTQNDAANRTNFTKYLPDNTIVVIGKRYGGAPVGEYQLVRNASNDFKPGSYDYVVDRANGVNGEKRTPANIEVHRGHTGGPAVMFPSAIVVMHV